MIEDTPATLSLTQYGEKVSVERPSSQLSQDDLSSMIVTLLLTSGFSARGILESVCAACEEKLECLG